MLSALLKRIFIQNPLPFFQNIGYTIGWKAPFNFRSKETAD